MMGWVPIHTPFAFGMILRLPLRSRCAVLRMTMFGGWFLCLVPHLLFILLFGLTFAVYNAPTGCHPERRGAPAERQAKDHSSHNWCSKWEVNTSFTLTNPNLTFLSREISKEFVQQEIIAHFVPIRRDAQIIEQLFRLEVIDRMTIGAVGIVLEAAEAQRKIPPPVGDSGVA